MYSAVSGQRVYTIHRKVCIINKPSRKQNGQNMSIIYNTKIYINVCYPKCIRAWPLAVHACQFNASSCAPMYLYQFLKYTIHVSTIWFITNYRSPLEKFSGKIARGSAWHSGQCVWLVNARLSVRRKTPSKADPGVPLCKAQYGLGQGRIRALFTNKQSSTFEPKTLYKLS